MRSRIVPLVEKVGFIRQNVAQPQWTINKGPVFLQRQPGLKE